MFIFHNYTIMILQSQIPLYSKKHWFIISRNRKSQLGFQAVSLASFGMQATVCILCVHIKSWSAVT